MIQSTQYYKKLKIMCTKYKYLVHYDSRGFKQTPSNPSGVPPPHPPPPPPPGLLLCFYVNQTSTRDASMRVQVTGQKI